MASEYEDHPEAVKTEGQALADDNIKWLPKMLMVAGVVPVSERRARTIFAAAAGANLVVRSLAYIAI